MSVCPFFCQSWVHRTQYTTELTMYLHQVFPSPWVVRDVSGRGQVVWKVFQLCHCQTPKNFRGFSFFSGSSDNLGSIFYVLNHVNSNFIANTAFSYISWAGNSRRYSRLLEKQSSCVVCQKSKEVEKSKKFNAHLCTYTFIFSWFSFKTYGLSFFEALNGCVPTSQKDRACSLFSLDV